MIDDYSDPNTFIGSIQFEYQPLARALVENCDWSWTTDLPSPRDPEAKLSVKQLRDYQLFLMSRVIARDIQKGEGNKRLFLSPTADIDYVWHEHLLYPILYAKMCKQLQATSPFNAVAEKEDAHPSKKQKVSNEKAFTVAADEIGDSDVEEPDDDEWDGLDDDEEDEGDAESVGDERVLFTEIIDHTPDSIFDKRSEKERRIIRMKQYVDMILPGYVIGDYDQT